jgi:hypothetical protein
MSTRGQKLVAADETTVLSKTFFDPIVVEDGECYRCFPDPPCANERDGLEIFSESDDLLNQFIASETVPRGRGRRFTNRDAMRS